VFLVRESAILRQQDENDFDSRRKLCRQLGRLLQHWRQARRKSQLALALDARISARHLSFVESGRAKPSHDMVLKLASALDVPFRERNALMTAAGYAHVYRETGLAQPELAQVQKAIQLIFEHQEPYPAVVMDRHWNLINSNNAAKTFFGLLLAGTQAPEPPNVLRLMFHPDGLRPWVTNWEAVAPSLIQRVHREAIGGLPDPATLKLLEEITSFTGVSEALRRPDLNAPITPLLAVKFRKGKLALNFFSAVTTLGTPLDVTLQEIRIECFFPADEQTAAKAAAGYG
jgi:transcriptional regulator with XRE-family HTH domain